ncbi:hypothetical protein Dimus_034526 [Dionaea muscipula]
MSGSEAGFMSGSNMGVAAAAALQPVIQNMRLSYNPDGTAVYKPVSGGSPSHHHHHHHQQQASGNGAGGRHAGNEATLTVIGMGGGGNMGMNMNIGGERMKKKRGRPRKYGPDGNIALSLSPTSAISASAINSASSFSTSPMTMPPSQTSSVPLRIPTGGGGGDGDGNGDVLASPPLSMGMKKPRGRPPGSGNKKHHFDAIGSIAIGFTPHVITVKAGEDVSSKIMSFSQNGPRAVCILSANGAISNVTLCQAATSGGNVTYEGRFEILSLSGSFILSETGGQRSRTGGLSVSLAGPDGRVLGGGVAGLLTAATPVQVVVGSFVPDGQKQPRPANQMEAAMSGPPKILTGSGPTGGGSPPSHGTLSESSCGGSGSSPLNQDYRSLQ